MLDQRTNVKTDMIQKRNSKLLEPNYAGTESIYLKNVCTDKKNPGLVNKN